MSRELTASRTFASGLAEFRPHRLTICRPLAQKKARGYRARIVWLRRVKSALRPHGLPPHKKSVAQTRPALVCRMKSAFARMGWLCRIKSALRTRARLGPSSLARSARRPRALSCRSPFPPLDTRPYFFTQAAKTVRKRFTNARACDIMLWQFGDMAQLVERCVRNA